MELTIKFIEDAFHKFNAEYFNGELKTPRFEIMHTKSLLGQCHWDKVNGKRTNYLIRVSDYYKRNERGYHNTILHEMIHLLIRQKNIKDTRTHHGQVFYRYADFINSYGWNVARTDSVKGLELNTDKVITYHMVAFKDKKGKYFLMRYKPYARNYFISKFVRSKDYYQDLIWFTSTENTKYGHFSECIRGVRGFYIDKKEYEALRALYAVREAV